MGNSGSNEVTLEQENGKFVQTEEGVQLSTVLVERLSTNSSVPKREIQETKKDVVEAEMLLQECQQMLGTKEQQVKELREKWRGEIQAQKEKTQSNHNQIIDEFTKSAAATETKFRKPTLKPICDILQQKLVDCYTENSSQPLICSSVLNDFKLCVDNAKNSLLSQEKSLGA